MPFLIYTDKENLSRSIRDAKVRVPSHLARIFDLRKVRQGDVLFLFDYESGKIHGPFSAGASGAREERNPRGGPFNGYGKVKSHYAYLSQEIDCSSLYRRGAAVEGFSADFRSPRFVLSGEEAKKILLKLRLLNRKKVPLVLQIGFEQKALGVTVVEMNRGTRIARQLLPVGDGFLSLLERKVGILEDLLRSGRVKKYESSLKQLGVVVYEAIMKPCGLARWSLI